MTRRYRLTIFDHPSGHDDHPSLKAAMAVARERTGGARLTRSKSTGRLLDSDGRLRGYLLPIEGAGRPPELGRARDTALKIRCLPEELDGWQQAAQARGESLSEGVRAALGERYGAGTDPAI